jgi:hypothetical protein
MLRRAFTIIAVLSASVFVALAGCIVRQHFASDHFHIYHWNPSTRNYTEINFYLGGQYFGAHVESTTALASDDTSIIQWRAGPSNLRFVHDAWPAGTRNDGPLLWGDHYRSTPSFGINQHGLSDCWTLQFRLELALVLFAVVPAIWALGRLRRWRSLAARGFAVVGDSAKRLEI